MFEKLSSREKPIKEARLEWYPRNGWCLKHAIDKRDGALSVVLRDRVEPGISGSEYFDEAISFIGSLEKLGAIEIDRLYPFRISLPYSYGRSIRAPDVVYLEEGILLKPVSEGKDCPIFPGEIGMSPNFWSCNAMIFSLNDKCIFRHQTRGCLGRIIEIFDNSQEDGGIQEVRVVGYIPNSLEDYVVGNFDIDSYKVMRGSVELQNNSFRLWVYLDEEEGLLIRATTDNWMNERLKIDWPKASEV